MVRQTFEPLAASHLQGLMGAVCCIVCDWDNTRGTDVCRRCQAPLGMAVEADRLGQRPRPLVALGGDGAGTTTWLGMAIELLTRGVGHHRLELRGASSLRLSQETSESLSRNRFPEPSPRDPEEWRWVQAQFFGGRDRLGPSWILPDVPGLSVMEALERPETLPVLPALMARAAGIFLCLNGAELARGNRRSERTAMRLISSFADAASCSPERDTRPVAIVMTHFSIQDAFPAQAVLDAGDRQQSPERRSVNRRQRPRGNMFSWNGRSDRRKNPDPNTTPKTALSTLAPALVQMLGKRKGPWNAFPVEVVPVTMTVRGLSGTTNLPLRVEPSGVVAPMIWLGLMLNAGKF